MFQLPLGLQVGSGKSSLLNLILGETRLINGSIYLTGSTAYVPQVNYPSIYVDFLRKKIFHLYILQVPWIMSGTIRDNILLGKDYDQNR